MEKYKAFRDSVTAPVCQAVEVTPNDATDLANWTRAVFVGVGGDVKVDMATSGTVTFKNILSGTTLPIRVRRIYATGTTAQSIVALR
jgi:hypothetical protein